MLRSFSYLTTTFAVIFGWIEQKYSYVPGLSNVIENLSSVSSAFDLIVPSLFLTVCGTSSWFTQVTVVPAATVRSPGMKAKLSIFTSAGPFATGAPAAANKCVPFPATQPAAATNTVHTTTFSMVFLISFVLFELIISSC